MPSRTINESLNKARVVSLYGAESTVGLIDPELNMLCRHGIDDRWVVGLASGNRPSITVKLALASGGAIASYAYPHELALASGTAHYFGWPNASGCVTLGRKSTWPNGVPNIIDSGMAFLDGTGSVSLFHR